MKNYGQLGLYLESNTPSEITSIGARKYIAILAIPRKVISLLENVQRKDDGCYREAGPNAKHYVNLLYMNIAHHSITVVNLTRN